MRRARYERRALELGLLGSSNTSAGLEGWRYQGEISRDRQVVADHTLLVLSTRIRNRLLCVLLDAGIVQVRILKQANGV